MAKSENKSNRHALIDVRTQSQKITDGPSLHRAGSSNLFRSDSMLGYDRQMTPEPLIAMESLKQDSIRQQLADYVYQEHEDRLSDTEEGKQRAQRFREWMNTLKSCCAQFAGISVDATEIRSATCKIRLASSATNAKDVPINVQQVAYIFNSKGIAIDATNPLRFTFNHVTDKEFERVGSVFKNILSGKISIPGHLSKKSSIEDPKTYSRFASEDILSGLKDKAVKTRN